MNLRKIAVALLMVTLLSGCAFSPEILEENPAPTSDIMENNGNNEDFVTQVSEQTEEKEPAVPEDSVETQPESEPELHHSEPEPIQEPEPEKSDIKEEDAAVTEKEDKSEASESVMKEVKPVAESIPEEKPEYIVLSAQGTRYTTSPLNIRKGPGTDYAVVKSISKGTEVILSGRTDNGWYQIKEGFVSGKYLSEKKPVVEAPKPTPAIPNKPSYSPYKIYLPYKTVSYKNGGTAKGQSVIDSQPALASTWGGAGTFSGTDGKNTHFIGHDYSAFKGLWNIGVGQTVTITDGNGIPYRYKITRRFVVDDYGVGVSDGEKYYNYITSTRGGEVVTFQTCKTKTTNWILRGELIN